STTTIDNFTAAVDKLDSTGRNWIIFQKRFTIAAKQKEVYSHLTGAAARPVHADPAKPTPTEDAAIASWDKKENLAMYLLTQKLHDVTLTKHLRKGTVAEIWSAVMQEFTQKSLLLRATM
ncbi:uncharacterized protein LAESUDRAFT_614166, partial [Laetiporus sulphureus 93-53]